MSQSSILNEALQPQSTDIYKPFNNDIHPQDVITSLRYTFKNDLSNILSESDTNSKNVVVAHSFGASLLLDYIFFQESVPLPDEILLVSPMLNIKDVKWIGKMGLYGGYLAEHLHPVLSYFDVWKYLVRNSNRSHRHNLVAEQSFDHVQWDYKYLDPKVYHAIFRCHVWDDISVLAAQSRDVNLPLSISILYGSRDEVIIQSSFERLRSILKHLVSEVRSVLITPDDLEPSTRQPFKSKHNPQLDEPDWRQLVRELQHIAKRR